MLLAREKAIPVVEPFRQGMCVVSFYFFLSLIYLSFYFISGWQREVSVRSKGETKCDIYYVTPELKKLRSLSSTVRYCKYEVKLKLEVNI